jgi:RNA polymerase sigma-70 factor (sigma-E family)
MRAAEDADFSNFVAASSRQLLRTAYLIADDLTVAEGLLQAVLDRACRRWPSILRKNVAEAYVRRLLVRAAVQAGRRREPHGAPLDGDQLPGAPDPGLGGLHGRAVLLSCVRQLPADQRAVLVLRYFDNLTEAATARALGCSVRTVQSQQNRAMARLNELVPGLAGSASTDSRTGGEHEREARR